MRVEKINSQQNFKGLYVKPSASKKLEYLFEKAPATLERRVECAKAIGTMQDRMKNNPVKVFVEAYNNIQKCKCRSSNNRGSNF